MPMSMISNIKRAMHQGFRHFGFDVVRIQNLDAALRLREREREEQHRRSIRDLRAKHKDAIPAANGGPDERPASGPRWVAAAELWDVGCSLIDEDIQSLLDIGCAFRPQDFVDAKIHICCEPCEEYMDRLIVETAGLPKFVYLRSDLEESSKLFPTSSIDSVCLIDVIEHVEREQGLVCLERLKRMARRQLALFTPIGFMPQESDSEGVDPWGLGGSDWQRHRSGWLPEDFPASDGWRVIACKDFHKL